MQSCKRQGSSWETPSLPGNSDMRYLLDTVVLVRHFTGSGKIGKKAARLLVSAISSDGKFAAVEGVEVVWG